MFICCNLYFGVCVLVQEFKAEPGILMLFSHLWITNKSVDVLCAWYCQHCICA